MKLKQLIESEYESFINEETTTKEDINNINWYHGTNNDFDKFDLNFFGETDSGWYGYGVYLHTSKETAKAYGKILLIVKLNLKNPLILPSENSDEYLYNLIEKIKPNTLSNDMKGKSIINIINHIGKKDFSDLLLDNGYDGLIAEYVNKHKEAVIFDPSKIKIVDKEYNNI